MRAFAATFGRADGSIIFDVTSPIKDVTAGINSTTLAYFQSFGFLGRNANISLAQPYLWGHVEGLVSEEFTRITRSGLADGALRFAVNLAGAPALAPREFVNYQQRTNLGASVTVLAPVGQYDPVKLINPGTNRWGFRPELGISHRDGRWLLEGAGGVWLFSDNDRFFEETHLERGPMLSLQGHLTYNITPRMWVGFDANYYRGGDSVIDGEKSDRPVADSRFGVTWSLALYRRHSVKFQYAEGVVSRLGNDFRSFAFTYQVIWFGLRR